MIKIPGFIATLLLTALVAWMGCDLFYRGASGLHAGYLVETPRNLGPMLANTGIIVGFATLLAALVSLPLAVAYTELAAPAGLRKIVRSVLDIGVGVPRIVWGLFGAAFFGGYCGFGFSLLTGILTLACLLAPIMTTGFIIGLEMVESEVREQCAALGVDSWQTAWRQVVPVALPGLGLDGVERDRCRVAALELAADDLGYPLVVKPARPWDRSAGPRNRCARAGREAGGD